MTKAHLSSPSSSGRDASIDLVMARECQRCARFDFTDGQDEPRVIPRVTRLRYERDKRQATHRALLNIHAVHVVQGLVMGGRLARGNGISRDRADFEALEKHAWQLGASR